MTPNDNNPTAHSRGRASQQGAATPNRPHRGRRRRLRRVAIFPALLTLGNMTCGFAAVYFCMLGIFDAAANVDPAIKTTLNNVYMEKFLPTFVSVGGFLVFIGMFFDMVDGRVARMTTGTTNFGGQLDSLADMVSFGVAPAMLMITLVTKHARLVDDVIVTTKEAWMAGAIYVSCCALRLARYNVEHAESDQAHANFFGMPSPGAAALVAALVILHEYLLEIVGLAGVRLTLLNMLPVIAFLAGILMVSRVRYAHVANRYLRGRRPFGYVVAILIVLGCFIRLPAPTLAVLAIFYALSGPILTIWRRYRPSPHAVGMTRQAARPSAQAGQSSHESLVPDPSSPPVQPQSGSEVPPEAPRSTSEPAAREDDASLRIYTPDRPSMRRSPGSDAS